MSSTRFAPAALSSRLPVPAPSQRQGWSTGFLMTAAAVGYLLLRFVSTVIMVALAPTQDPRGFTGNTEGYWGLANLWDAAWYRRIAEDGYPDQLPRNAAGEVQQNPWAFYPMFPMLARVITTLTGVDFEYVGPTLALVLGIGAAMAIAAVLRAKVGPRAALAGVAVWAAYPASPALQMAYTESLAVLLLCGVLWMLHREEWWGAAGIALATGLARPIALPLGLVALVAVWLRWRSRHTRSIRRAEWVAMAAALAACGIAGLIWPLVVWWGTGESDGYELTMASWRGSGEVVPFVQWWHNAEVLVGDWAPVLLAVLGLGLLALVLGPWARGLGWQLRAWCLAYPAYLVAVLDPWTSTIRYLLPLFPLAVVLVGGGWTARGDRDDRPSWLLWVRTAVVVGLSLAWQVWWVREILVLNLPADYPP